MISPISLGSKRRGFTLIELIIVIAIIAIIVAAVFVAIDPAKRLNTSRNSRRNQDATALASGLQLWKTDIITAGNTPAAVSDGSNTTWEQIGTATSGCNIACNGSSNNTTLGACRNLSTLSGLVPQYIKALPQDPKGGNAAGTKYAINEDGGAIIIRACNAEGEGAGGSTPPTPVIEISR